MQASVSTVGQPSFLQTTYKFDMRRDWDAVSTQTQCHIHIVPQVKHPRFNTDCDLFWPSRRGLSLTPRTSARTLGEARINGFTYVTFAIDASLSCATNASSVGSIFCCDLSKITSN